MGLIEKQNLVNGISPPIDRFLASQLLDEFVSIERRFIQRDWEPAELDGGQFCEILARIVHSVDIGHVNLSKKFDDCCTFVESNSSTHKFLPRSDALHLVKVARTDYKFRSQRGAVHISPTYQPNHMDSKFVIEGVRWCMNEILRIFWQGDRELVAKAIRELLQFDVPAIGKFDDILLVQRTDLTVEEEVLLLLHYAGEVGMSRTEVGRFCNGAPSTITNVISRLVSSKFRQVVPLKNRNYRLTDLGSKRVREQLAAKLTLE